MNSQVSPKIAEVIEASIVEFTAQCYELYVMPPLGSLVKTGDIFGIVANAETTGLEPGRKAIARGKDEPTESAVYESSPQLSKLLKSQFTAVVVGYKKDGRIHQHLSPQPARIHGFVYLCPPEEVDEFSKSFSFLNILLNAVVPIPVEELIAAALRQMGRVQEDSRAFLVAGGKELAGLLSSNITRLKNILEKLKIK
ncbi:MAG: hypothetical protein A2Y90_04910 [Chloroflexi bacterium RBG_13_52_12]|nr:MAG: hypothetical protein A2Y90_04910 [Chloroflexi bacterium RBG_13_52_12]